MAGAVTFLSGAEGILLFATETVGGDEAVEVANETSVALNSAFCCIE